MKPQPITKTTELREVTVGAALIAQPFLDEEIYKRAVILIISHDEYRTRGIILNKASSATIRTAFPGIVAEDSIYFGGPMVPEKITADHCISGIPEAKYLARGISIDGDPDCIQQLMRKEELDLEKIKFCAGVVEWGPGELEHELSQSDWWLSTISCHEVFEIPPEILWSNLLLQMDNVYGLIAALPDPSVN